MSRTSRLRPATDLEPEPATDAGLSRRSVLTRSAAGVGIALTGSYAGLFGAGAASASAGSAPGKPGPAGYGPLVDDPAGLLSLPAGFSYTIVAESGVTRLDSGEPTPSDPDGTASFVRHGGNGSVLVVNHEISGSEPYARPARSPASSTTRPPRAARRPSRSTRTATACASTSASPARTTTARAAGRRGTRG